MGQNHIGVDGSLVVRLWNEDRHYIKITKSYSYGP